MLRVVDERDLQELIRAGDDLVEKLPDFLDGRNDEIIDEWSRAKEKILQ